MAQVTTLGVDIAKNGVCVHGIDTQEHVIVKKRLARQKVLPFMAQLPPCLIGMEASGGAHYWAREFTKLGHTVKLMSPQFVKPYVQSQKNHIPSDLVVDRGASEMKSSSSLDFLFLCSVWTTFCCLMSDKITSAILMAWDFTTKSGGICNFSWRDAQNFFDAFDDSHGRLVRRRVWAMTDLAPLPALAKWPGLQSVIAVETIRTAHQHAPVTSDYRFYLASLVRPADTFARMMRQHWHIENKLHWSLDVTFNEDRSRLRKDHAAENMASLRRVALNLLRQEPSRQISLRQKRLLCSLDESYLLTVIARAT